MATFRMKHITVKEITDKYPDKVINITFKNDKPVIVLDTMRIVFTNKKFDIADNYYFYKEAFDEWFNNN